MRICGLQKLSMVDYPDRLAATVFTGGCDLRCPFCHNAPLVTRTAETPTLSEEEVLTFLKSRRGYPCIIKSIKDLLNNKGGGQGPGASFSDQLLELVSQPGFLGLWLPPCLSLSFFFSTFPSLCSLL